MGNLIALPLQKDARVSRQHGFLNPDTWEIVDQWEMMAGLSRFTEDEVDAALLTPVDNTFAPVAKPARRPTTVTVPARKRWKLPLPRT